jgi:two-component system response regulator FixJ
MSSIKKQIFIVDDDESVCRALNMLLITYGFNVMTFHTAEDFFNVVTKDTLGCLILDLHLPGLDGWGTQRRLNELGSKLPIVMISADKNEGLKERILKTGAAGFLQKPFHDNELMALINQGFESV